MAYKFENVSSVYGAPMGRADWPGDGVSPVKLHLVRVQMVAGDYDKGGAYWGGGRDTMPLYIAYGEDASEQVRFFVRASTRETAKALVRSRRKAVTFYR